MCVNCAVLVVSFSCLLLQSNIIVCLDGWIEPLWTFPREAPLWVLANWRRLAAALPGQMEKKEKKIGKGKRVFTILDVSFPDGRPEEVEDLEGNNIAAASVSLFTWL